MRLRASTRAAAFAVAVMAFAGSMTGVAWAPKNLTTPVLTAGCNLQNGGPGSFLGSLSITGFTVVDGGLAAVGTMTGTCDPDAGTARPVTIPQGTTVVVPVAVDALTCDVLDLRLGQVSIPALGMTVYLSGEHVPAGPATKGERARFCAAARLVETRPAAQMTTPLTHLIFQ